MPAIEFHVHTKAGSADSSVSADALADYAARERLGAVVVAEHFRVWADWERDAFFDRTGARLYRAIEATTDHGHLIVVGAPAGFSPSRSAIDLLALARREGWFTIFAHPFRHYFDPPQPNQRGCFDPGQGAETLAGHAIFRMVDAIEVENGACTERENALACAVARQLDLPVTSGSDAHSLAELGRRRLRVDDVPRNERELADLIYTWRLDRLPVEGE